MQTPQTQTQLFKVQCMMGTPVSEKLSHFYLILLSWYLHFCLN